MKWERSRNDEKLVKILLYLTLFATFFLLDRFAFPHPVLRVLAMAFGVLLGAALNTIVTSVSILALVFGFGAESLAADVVTGFFLLFESQYNAGDIVEVGGFRGTVKEIGGQRVRAEDCRILTRDFALNDYLPPGTPKLVCTVLLIPRPADVPEGGAAHFTVLQLLDGYGIPWVSERDVEY